MDVKHLEALVPYATEGQSRCLLALSSAKGNLHAAARALKLDRQTIRGAVKAAQKRAAARGFAPEHGWNPPEERTEPSGTLPDGFRLKGVSELVDADGKRSVAWNKSQLDPVDPPARPIGSLGAPIRMSTFVDSQGKQIGQWVTEKPEERDRLAALLEGMKQSVAEYVRPVAPVRAPRATELDTQSHYLFGDPHIGMLAYGAETGDSFDLKIAERDLLSAMDRLVDSMPPSETAVLLPLGDNFHADDDFQRTPAHHHKLDVDGRASKVARVGVNIMRHMIDRALQKHRRVIKRITKGNHDPVSSMWLQLCLEGWYANEPRVTIVNDVSPMQAWQFGTSMCAVTHGDGVKVADMPGVMASRFAPMWGATKHHYGYQGHKHKREVLEKHGAIIEVFPTLAGKDSFANKFGYESEQSATGIVLHQDHGMIERKIVSLSLARLGVACG